MKKWEVKYYVDYSSNGCHFASMLNEIEQKGYTIYSIHNDYNPHSGVKNYTIIYYKEVENEKEIN